MPRIICLEDGYEYRVKSIFKRLRQEYADEETDVPFDEWLNIRHEIVARLFLEDVETYMGIPPEDDTDGRSG